MGITRISWTHYSFNLWWGCSHVSPGCLNCYADATAKRYGHGGLWHRSGPRRTFGDAYWRKPLTWNRKAAAAGTVYLVFACSMADVFEIHPDPIVNAVMDAQRARFWKLIAETPFLTWQLLTKRPENVPLLAPWGDRWPDNVWLGTSVEDTQRAYERLGRLVTYDAQIPVRFVSVEPQLEHVDISPWLARGHDRGANWILAGGESGAGARPYNLDWARDLRDQVEDSDAAYWMKQTGSRTARELGLTGKGEEWDELPQDLQIRDFPEAYTDRICDLSGADIPRLPEFSPTAANPLITAPPTTMSGALR